MDGILTLAKKLEIKISKAGVWHVKPRKREKYGTRRNLERGKKSSEVSEKSTMVDTELSVERR